MNVKKILGYIACFSAGALLALRFSDPRKQINITAGRASSTGADHADERIRGDASAVRELCAELKRRRDSSTDR